MRKLTTLAPALFVLTFSLFATEVRADAIVAVGVINGSGTAADFSYSLPAGQDLHNVVIRYSLTARNNTDSRVTVLFQVFGRDTITASFENAGVFNLADFFNFNSTIRPEFLPLFFTSNSARLELLGLNAPPDLTFTLNSATLHLQTSTPPPPPQPVPEPGTLFLLSVGLAGAVAHRRRRLRGD